METEYEALAAAWCSADRACAVLPVDHRIIEGSVAVRAMILALAQSGGSDEELYDACAVLGRQIALQGGTPSFAAQTIDHASAVLNAQGARWVAAARAALIEAFVSALADNARQEAMDAWEFPKCVVVLDERLIAIAAGHPSDDPELLSEWASRLANAAARKSVRHAVVSGREAARSALEEALTLVGIEVQPPSVR